MNVIDIRDKPTGTRTLVAVDNRSPFGQKGFIECHIEVTGSTDKVSDGDTLDVLVFGVPYIGKVSSTAIDMSWRIAPTQTKSYIVKLAAKEGYDYTKFLKPDWSEHDRQA